MGALMRAFDWAATPIGPPEGWPQSLRVTVRLMLSSRHPMLVWWGDELIQFYNDAYRATMGPERHPSALGQRGRACWEEIWPIIGPQIEQVMSGGGATWHEDQLVPVTRHGRLEQVWWTYGYSPIDEEGGVGGVLVVCNDVTQGHLAHERLRIAQSAGKIGAFEWYPDTGRLEVSDEYRRIWGLPPEGELTDRQLLDLVDRQDRAETGLAKLGHRDNALDYAEYRIRRPDTGEIRWIARQGEVLHVDADRRRYVGVTYDITQRKRAEAALEESERRFRLMADAAPALIWATDAHGGINFANARHQTDYGVPPEEIYESGWRRLVYAADLDRLSAEAGPAFIARQPFEVEVRMLDKEGRLRWLRCAGAPRFEDGAFVGYIGCNVDITDARLARDALEAQVAERAGALQRAEEALRQSHKMEAIGQLTGGIAHDFNNLLTGVIGSLELMKRRIEAGRIEELGRFMDAAVASANRAASLTHRLLAFARRQSLDPQPVDVNQRVASMEDLLARTLGEQVTLKTALAEDLWPALADDNQLESAILNLAINARDAMPTGGLLTIGTTNIVLDDDYVSRHEGLTPGQYVALQVSDTGIGMTPDVAAKAFDPFFTTKPIGQGTGLGLSMIYGFARQSGGHAAIHTAPGEGTTIALYLPRAAAPAAEPAVVESGPVPRGQGETVLVVEDDPAVQLMAVEVLQDLGYAVLKASNADEAMAIIESPVRIDLLVSDVGLPGVNGRQLAEMARLWRRGLKVLFITGYAESAAVRSGFLTSGMALIAKPFAFDVFAAKVREMVSEAPET